MPGVCPCQVLGLCDSNSSSHILAGMLMLRVSLSGNFGGLLGVILTRSVISAGFGAEIRSHLLYTSLPSCDGSCCLLTGENLQDNPQAQDMHSYLEMKCCTCVSEFFFFFFFQVKNGAGFHQGATEAVTVLELLCTDYAPR